MANVSVAWRDTADVVWLDTSDTIWYDWTDATIGIFIALLLDNREFLLDMDNRELDLTRAT